MRPIIIGFGLLILCLLILFKIGEVNFTKGNVKLEVIVAIVAFIFFFVGLYFNNQSQKKSSTGTNEISANSYRDSSRDSPQIDYDQIKKVGLTQREHDVLVKMADGLSNLEIAEQLFLSESTVKTHVSNILFKLDAKRRTQAVQAAKKLKIVT